ncbi:hypothetical protein K9N68_26675 [Kovacikia minuta CCNUW1]|uniref:hypothetical protein n=1 Tax=Kovacikia minuta TaxID=2931930 RepID=UPI001CCC04DB|nr:hypothetical protein [Kovacikia minuta]UBF25177.1 hypothetical protein K9N68_26675 [Kovacikia minuta CCNUW1]
MAGSLLNKNTILHAIAITLAIAIFSGQFPLNSILSPSILDLNWFVSRLTSNP